MKACIQIFEEEILCECTLYLTISLFITR